MARPVNQAHARPRTEHDVDMIERVVLAGDVVTLRPLTLDDVDALVAAASEDRATYGFTPVPDGDAAMRAYVEAVLADERGGWALPFVTTRTDDGAVVGSTRFLDLDDWSSERRVGGPPLGATTTASIGPLDSTTEFRASAAAPKPWATSTR